MLKEIKLKGLLMKKHEITKEILVNNKVRVEFDNEGQPIIYQEYIPHKYGQPTRWKEKKTILTAVCKHKYAEDKHYPIVTLRLNGKQKAYSLSNIVWVYFNDRIPEGYDIDHIDDNPFNNSIDNLQMLTRKENLKKRPNNGANQYTYGYVCDEDMRQRMRDGHRRAKELKTAIF